jgi:hypothetical protein
VSRKGKRERDPKEARGEWSKVVKWEKMNVTSILRINQESGEA